MEVIQVIFTLIGIYFLYWLAATIIGLFFKGLGKGVDATKAVVKSAASGKSFKEAYDDISYQMGPLECKTHQENIELNNKKNKKGFVVSIRGIINHTETPMNLVAVTSFFDITEKESYDQPILTNFTDIVEPNSRAMQIRIPIGEHGGYVGYTKWIEFMNLFADWMIPPRSGKRKIRGIVRFIPNSEEAIAMIDLGLSDKELHPAALATFDFEANLKETGYLEIHENFFKIREFFVRFGILVSYADGDFRSYEGQIIKKWMTSNRY